MATPANSRMSAELSGIVIATNYAGMASDPARVQYLIDLIQSESPSSPDLQPRLYLDEMTPMCRNTLVAHLTKMKAAIT